MNTTDLKKSTFYRIGKSIYTPEFEIDTLGRRSERLWGGVYLLDARPPRNEDDILQ